MGRKNHRNSRPQARRKADGTKGQPRPPAPPIEKLVVPKGRCYFRSRHGKLVFNREEAETALRQAQASRARRGTGHKESRIYECPEGGCGGWHLTSRTQYQERGQAS